MQMNYLVNLDVAMAARTVLGLEVESAHLTQAARSGLLRWRPPPGVDPRGGRHATAVDQRQLADRRERQGGGMHAGG